MRAAPGLAIRKGLALACLVAVLIAPARARAFVLEPTPPANRLTMNLDLGGTPFQTRGYGTQSWNDLARSALQRWNQVGVGAGQDHAFFNPVDATAPGDPCNPDGVNEVRFSSTVCGMTWGDRIAITLSYSIGGRTVEADTMFNSTLPLNAYPGPIVASANGDPLIDFFRLALHEFGHALGLDHPNLAGQQVVAIMNQGVNQAIGATVDNLQPDDIAGAHAVDWPPGAASAAATNTALAAFVTGMYSNALDRAPSDAEVSAWVTFLNAHRDTEGARTIVHSFFDGPEYRARRITPATHVEALYGAILGRSPDPVGQPTFEGLVVARYNTLLPGFLNSAEFKAVVVQGPAALVMRLYQQALGRTPAADEAAAWTNYLASTGDTLGVVKGFFDSAEYLATPRTYGEHVTVLYRTLLGRAPSPGEVEAWVDVLVAQLADLEDQMVGSPEFQARFQGLFQ